jgi:NADPH-dependent F420 reductase
VPGSGAAARNDVAGLRWKTTRAYNDRMTHPAIAVLGGTGQQGRGIAQRLALAGFPVVVGSRDPQRAGSAIAEWPAAARSSRAADYGEAIAAARVVVLAVPFDAAASILERHQESFAPQTLVIDVTVPLTFSGGTVMLSVPAEGSAAEHVRARLPAHARLAAAFKTVPAHLLNDPARSLDCDEFVCGDSAEARSEASAIVEAMEGLRAVDVGPLTRARSIEHLTLLAIGINRRHKIHDARFRIVGL